MAIVLTIQSTGCAGWSVIPTPTAQTPAEPRWKDFRVAVDSDVDFELSRARVSADSVVGVLGKVRVGSRRADSAQVGAVVRRFGVAGADERIVAVPLAGVRRLERYSDPLGPLPILILAGLGLMLVIAGTGLEGCC
jgi:hypothetical protein